MLVTSPQADITDKLTPYWFPYIVEITTRGIRKFSNYVANFRISKFLDT